MIVSIFFPPPPPKQTARKDKDPARPAADKKGTEKKDADAEPANAAPNKGEAREDKREEGGGIGDNDAVEVGLDQLISNREKHVVPGVERGLEVEGTLFHREERLQGIMGEDGITNCGNAQNCVKVCPMNIPLTKAIYEENRETVLYGLLGWLTK